MTQSTLYIAATASICDCNYLNMLLQPTLYIWLHENIDCLMTGSIYGCNYLDVTATICICCCNNLWIYGCIRVLTAAWLTLNIAATTSICGCNYLTCLCVWHDSFIICDRTHSCVCDMTIYALDMTHSHVWHDSFTWVWHDSFTCVTWLTHMCVTCNLNRRLPTRKSLFIHVCDMTQSHVWPGPFMCVTW